jgi:hypothetical protein
MLKNFIFGFPFLPAIKNAPIALWSGRTALFFLLGAQLL